MGRLDVLATVVYRQDGQLKRCRVTVDKNNISRNKVVTMLDKMFMWYNKIYQKVESRK